MPAEIDLRSEDAAALLQLRRRRSNRDRRRRFVDGPYFDSPSAFVRDCMNFPMDPKTGRQRALIGYQADVMETLNREHRLAVRGPRGLGKTFIAACLVWWFALTRNQAGIDWKIASTAGSNLQLKMYLWPEIEKVAKMIRWDVVGRPPITKFELLTKQLKLAGPGGGRSIGYGFGASVKDKALIEGCHASEVLGIFDESKAIPDEIFDAFEGAFSTGNCYALMLSTPGDPNGRFYDIHMRNPELAHWKAVHVTAEQAVAAGQIPASWIETQRGQWGADSRLFLAHCLGEFSTKSSDKQIPLMWVEAAIERWEAWQGEVRELLGIDEGNREPVKLGELGAETRSLLVREGLLEGPLSAVASDVAGGGRDSSLVASRYGRVCSDIEIGSSDTMKLVGSLVARLKENLQATAIVDIQTVGKGAGDRLREQGYNLIPFNGGHSTKRKNITGDIEYHDTRSAAYGRIYDLLNPANEFDIMLPKFEVPTQKLSLMGDLTYPKFYYGSSGKLRIESKNGDEDEEGRGGLRRKLGRSTDAGDTISMLFWPGEPAPAVDQYWAAGGDQIRTGI